MALAKVRIYWLIMYQFVCFYSCIYGIDFRDIYSTSCMKGSWANLIFLWLKKVNCIACKVICNVIFYTTFSVYNWEKINDRKILFIIHLCMIRPIYTKCTFFWKDASSSKEVYPHKKFLLMCSRQIVGDSTI